MQQRRPSRGASHQVATRGRSTAPRMPPPGPAPASRDAPHAVSRPSRGSSSAPAAPAEPLWPRPGFTPMDALVSENEQLERLSADPALSPGLRQLQERRAKASGAVASASHDRTLTMRYYHRQRLVELFDVYCPPQLERVSSLLDEFANREYAFFAALERKYGPEPRKLPSPVCARLFHLVRSAGFDAERYRTTFAGKPPGPLFGHILIALGYDAMLCGDLEPGDARAFEESIRRFLDAQDRVDEKRQSALQLREQQYVDVGNQRILLGVDVPDDDTDLILEYVPYIPTDAHPPRPMGLQALEADGAPRVSSTSLIRDTATLRLLALAAATRQGLHAGSESLLSPLAHSRPSSDHTVHMSDLRQRLHHYLAAVSPQRLCHVEALLDMVRRHRISENVLWQELRDLFGGVPCGALRSAADAPEAGGVPPTGSRQDLHNRARHIQERRRHMFIQLKMQDLAQMKTPMNFDVAAPQPLAESTPVTDDPAADFSERSDRSGVPPSTERWFPVGSSVGCDGALGDCVRPQHPAEGRLSLAELCRISAAEPDSEKGAAAASAESTRSGHSTLAPTVQNKSPPRAAPAYSAMAIRGAHYGRLDADGLVWDSTSRLPREIFSVDRLQRLPTRLHSLEYETFVSAYNVGTAADADGTRPSSTGARSPPSVKPSVSFTGVGERHATAPGALAGWADEDARPLSSPPIGRLPTPSLYRESDRTTRSRPATTSASTFDGVASRGTSAKRSRIGVRPGASARAAT